MTRQKNIGRIDEDFLVDVDSAATALGQSRMKFVRLALEARLSQLRGPGLRYTTEVAVDAEPARGKGPIIEPEQAPAPAPERFDAQARAHVGQLRPSEGGRPIIQKRR